MKLTYLLEKTIEGTAAGITSVLAACSVLLPILASTGYIFTQVCLSNHSWKCTSKCTHTHECMPVCMCFFCANTVWISWYPCLSDFKFITFTFCSKFSCWLSQEFLAVMGRNSHWSGKWVASLILMKIRENYVLEKKNHFWCRDFRFGIRIRTRKMLGALHP